MLWRTEYERFVDRMAYGAEDERIGFDAAVAACRRLVEQVMPSAR